MFSHVEVPEAQLRPLVPAPLSIDFYEGRCFVGIVMFEMRQVRAFRSLPSVPTATNFAQINVRTYVHHAGAEPGVFFLSLDCEGALVARVARALWRVPYHYARITRSEAAAQRRRRAERRSSTPSAAPFEVDFSVGAELPQAEEGSLAFFLTERYQFYAGNARSLHRVRVHHVPYPLHRAHVTTLGDSLLEATGLTSGERTPDYWSPGVDVDVYAQAKIARR